ncbi:MULTISPECIES: DUF2637 domain-containing protein [unclassified Streptomyces]|uniref:DUF2637 domain-containing protein n=1 Tax=unclassified Streptomyces TaxID=2593676 RepID=UPI000A7131C3|nr:MULTISPECIES: DUF2637 domain-containing protein [unclassified Streptomyces]
MKLPSPSKALAIGAGVVIVALTGAAFWLSYAHLAEVALGHGLRQAPARAWAWPATLDLFIVAGELLMLRAALAKRVDGWAIALTAVGSVGSIVLNVAGVTGTRDPGTVPVLDYVVAAVPPTAALLAFGALMRQIHQALAGHDDVDVIHVSPAPEVTQIESPAAPEAFKSDVIQLEAAPEVWSKTTPAVPEVPAEPAAVEAEPVSLEKGPVPAAEPLPTVPALPVLGPWTPVAELLAVPAGTSRDLHASGHPEGLQAASEQAEEHPEPPPVPPVPPTGSAADIVSEDTSNTTFNRQVADARNWLAADPELTGTAIGQRLGKSDTYGRRVRRAALTNA